ncbi:sodium/proton-potassium antiporter GerN (CPA2 family) [Natranaerovirga pectinivora]|uniref:Sodium/proton-potassium antiporter GerN (CPA2 family) n=1 Tax=Natranaerovirga pectinivora TaxID=682400 RepID=A0A4R3MP87_9FIRM|nr:cation:proton antiporter [Natranaerovirga pectinivora]TCT13998.1 sodium/proton-potassium antiporter GerN (CPA2 family) [Natranaerovirga pectinivora]
MATEALRDVAIILLFTKLFGVITRKYSMTQVLGALLAGIILGPTVFNIFHDHHFIETMGEIGVIIILFVAGMQTDLRELKKCSKAMIFIAVLGVIFPFLGGFAVASFFGLPMLETIFIGIILTTTSVSITVETLMELGKLRTSTGVAIIGAAVLDDILGIIILTFLIGRLDPTTTSFSMELLKIAGFFIFVLIAGVIFRFLFNWFSEREGKKRRIPVFGFVFCLVLAYVASLFSVPDITGAYIAGLIVCNTVESDYIEHKLEVLSYMFFAPMHFAYIGINTVIGPMEGRIILFIAVLSIVAILTKIGGCTLGAKLSGFKGKQSVQIGIGMVCRGEIALIIANRGYNLGLISEKYFVPVIIVIIITTLITPLLLKLAFRGDSEEIPTPTHSSHQAVS